MFTYNPSGAGEAGDHGHPGRHLWGMGYVCKQDQDPRNLDGPVVT